MQPVVRSMRRKSRTCAPLFTIQEKFHVKRKWEKSAVDRSFCQSNVDGMIFRKIDEIDGDIGDGERYRRLCSFWITTITLSLQVAPPFGGAPKLRHSLTHPPRIPSFPSYFLIFSHPFTLSLSSNTTFPLLLTIYQQTFLFYALPRLCDLSYAHVVSFL